MNILRALVGLTYTSSVGLAMVLAGCATTDEANQSIVVLEKPREVLSFEEYRDRAMRIVNGQRVYNVEWDLFFASEGDLYAYFMSRVQQEVDKSTAIVDESTGARLTFGRNGTALNIRYCVSTSLGAYQAQAISDMAVATRAWQDVANVRFVYDATQDGNCVSATNQIDVAVIPTWGASNSACATPPYLPAGTIPVWCPSYSLGTLAMDYASWPWSWVNPDYPNLTSAGVLRHELGHILGLRHEHVRVQGCEDAIICSGTACLGADYLTDYDINSVMQYPHCGGIASTAWNISILDGVGARAPFDDMEHAIGWLRQRRSRFVCRGIRPSFLAIARQFTPNPLARISRAGFILHVPLL